MAEKPICFVVSPIGPDRSDVRKRADMVLRYVIKPAAERVQLKAERADASSAPGDVTVQLLDDLMSARAVIADLTDLNPNVFYELAVAHSFRKPVVTIADKDTKLPFDIIAQRTIFFDYIDTQSIDEAVARIADGLTAAMQEPGKNSPIMRAAQWQPLRHGDATGRALAELSDQVSNLRTEIHRYEPRSTLLTIETADPWDLPPGLVNQLDRRAQDIVRHIRDVGIELTEARALTYLSHALNKVTGFDGVIRVLQRLLNIELVTRRQD